jgi:hypothetical protein
MLANGFIHSIGDIRIRDARDHFGPRQSGALAFREKRCLLPGRQGVKALLAFALGARVFRVDVEAVRAAINLGSARFGQLQQGYFSTIAKTLYGRWKTVDGRQPLQFP